MGVYCETCGLTQKDLKVKIDNLSEQDRMEIMWQIDMYERGRKYYTKYINKIK